MAISLIKKICIIKIIRNTDLARTFVVEPLEGWKPEYQPGQFITLVFQTRRGEQRRSYSFSSSPDTDAHLWFTVKKLDNGEFSRLLIYKAKAGDELLTTGISGFFVLPEKTNEKHFCFLAAGSGITPCYSMIKTLLATTQEKIILLYSNRSEADTIFYEELQNLQKKYADRFYIHFMFSNRFDVLQRRLSDWLLTHLLNKHIPLSLRQHTLFYICGPYDYMLMATISLKNNGVVKGQIMKEDFYPLPRLVKPKPPDTDTHQVTLHINGKTATVRVQYPNTITAAAKEANIAVPYSCESGRCGSCVATCISGKIWMAYNEVLMDDEIAKGRVLTCQGYPVGGDAEIVF